jgi:hypothetical protein
MSEVVIGILVFVCLTGATLACLFLHERMPEGMREERTLGVVRLAIGMIVVMTSLVLGLLIASGKNNFDAIDRDVHAFGTQLILLDRGLKLYGPEAVKARSLLIAYVERALAGTWPKDGRSTLVEDPVAGHMLDEVEQILAEIKPSDPTHVTLLAQAMQRLHRLIELRWTMIEQSSGTVSMPLLVMLVGWLTLTFASFGYNAPRNMVVVVTLILCTASIATAVFLIIDMSTPFEGIVQVSPKPIERALDVMQRG